MNKKGIIIAVVLIACTVLYRIANNSLHIFNFTPLIAVSLFAGAYLQNNKMAMWVPILIMLLTDVFFELFTDIPGFYGAGQLVNYAALVLVALLGSNLKTPNFARAGLLTIGGSLLFFVLSNIGVWAFSDMYAKGIAGLGECFAMAMPFYNADSTHLFFNSLVGNLGTSLLLFGAWWYVPYSKLIKAKV